MAGTIPEWQAATCNTNLAADIITGLENGCRCKKNWKSAYRQNEQLTINRNNFF
jgi:hypothetical protein